jgi:predicted amidophosphoribosyltransferase
MKNITMNNIIPTAKTGTPVACICPECGQAFSDNPQFEGRLCPTCSKPELPPEHPLYQRPNQAPGGNLGQAFYSEAKAVRGRPHFSLRRRR